MKKSILVLVVFCISISLNSTLGNNNHLIRKSGGRQMDNEKTKIYTVFMTDEIGRAHV